MIQSRHSLPEKLVFTRRRMIKGAFMSVLTSWTCLVVFILCIGSSPSGPQSYNVVAKQLPSIPSGGASSKRFWSSISTSSTTTKTSPSNRKLPAPSSPSKSSAAILDGLKSGLASAMSAACVKTLLQPIDAIKTFQQYTYAAQGQSPTVLQACQTLASRKGGILGNFYAGLGVTVFGAMPGVALYFGVYSYCKKQFLNTTFGENHKVLAIAMSAAIGNSIASFSRVPYEVVKQQLQTQAYESTWQAFRTMAQSGQVLRMIFPKGGVAVQMLRDVPYAVVTLLVYESLQSHFGNQQQQQGPPNKSKSGTPSNRNKIVDFCLGGISGGLGSWVTNPVDVVKTRLQTSSEMYGGSVWACTQSVWEEGGASAFLRGSVPRLLHKVPANAFFFLFYEVFRRVLRVEETVDKQQQR